MDKRYLDPKYEDKYWSLVEQDILHHYDFQTVHRNLDKLFGLVALRQNRLIMEVIRGRRILDVGAGFGTLLKLLQDHDFEAAGIDINVVAMRYAKERYQVEILPADVYAMPFQDHAFDTVILRMVVPHLHFERALSEVERVCGKEIIIVEANSAAPLLRVGRWMAGITEHNEQPMRYYRDMLATRGYTTTVSYNETLALALSGGLATSQKIPHWHPLYPLVMGLDEIVHRAAKLLHLEKFTCWRYLLHAIKPT